MFWGLGEASPRALAIKNTGVGGQEHALAPTETSRQWCVGASLTSLTLLRKEARNPPATLLRVWGAVTQVSEDQGL